MISAGVLHRLPSERATEPFALLRVLPRRRFIRRPVSENNWENVTTDLGVPHLKPIHNIYEWKLRYKYLIEK